MIVVYIHHNPLAPHQKTIGKHEAPTSLRALTRIYAKAEEWELPTVATVNGTPWLRERWDETIPDGSVVVFTAKLRGGGNSGYISGGLMIAAGIGLMFTGNVIGGTLLIGTGAMAIYAQSKVIGMPSIPTSLAGEAGSPTYSLDYRQNRKRVGEPIPVVYGRHRLYPDLIAEPYYWINNNEEYVALRLCLGMGEFEIEPESLRFGEAPFSELDGVQWALMGPGDTPDLQTFMTSTSQAVNGQTINGPTTGTVILPAGKSIAITSYAWQEVGGTWYYAAKLVGSDSVFASLNVGNKVSISGSTDYNGDWELRSKDDDNTIYLTPWNNPPLGNRGFTPSRSNNTGVYTITSGADTINMPSGTLTCAASTSRFTHLAGTFSSLASGSVVTVSGTTSNNGVKNVTAVAADGSYITVSETVTDETATNAGITGNAVDWIGWYEVGNAAETHDIMDFGIDILFPRGLGSINSGTGAVTSKTVRIMVQYQELDANGDPTGSMTVETTDISASTVRPYRVSTYWAASTGYTRMRARIGRTTTESTNNLEPDQATAIRMKALYDYNPVVDQATTLSVWAKVTEQLTAQQSGQVNLIATRKIPTHVTSPSPAWTDNTATSSIAWALADVLRDTTYGMGLADSEIDITALDALESTWSGRGDEFNGVFDQSLTCWEALERIARAGRARPILVGGMVTFVRDEAKSTRMALYGPSVMSPDSLSVDYRFPQEADPDGTTVSYIDPLTWLPATYTYKEGGGTPTNPQKLDLFGVTNLAQATREAKFLDRVRLYRRKVIRWQTEAEGHLLTPGDLVGISHDVPAWGKTAVVIGTSVSGSDTLIQTSEPVAEGWTTGNRYIILRKPNGDTVGPLQVYAEPTLAPYGFKTATSGLGFTLRTDLGQGERTLLAFGAVNAVVSDVVVTDVVPQGSTAVEVTAVPYDSRVHATGA